MACVAAGYDVPFAVMRNSELTDANVAPLTAAHDVVLDVKPPLLSSSGFVVPAVVSASHAPISEPSKSNPSVAV
jgi:hypothetical protein